MLIFLGDSVEDLLLRFIQHLDAINHSNRPLLNEEYLSIIHNIEVHFGSGWRTKNKQLHEKINSIFRQYVQFGGGAGMFNSVCKKRTSFLGENGPFLPSVVEISVEPKEFDILVSFPLLNSNRRDKDIDHLEHVIPMEVNMTSLLLNLEKYADLKSHIRNEFEEVMNCYHFILRYHENEEQTIRIQRKLLLLKRRILSPPSTRTQYEMPSNTETEAHMKSITEAEEFADKFLSAELFSDAAFHYQHLLLSIQGYQNYYKFRKRPHEEIDQVAKRIFSKFLDSHLGKPQKIQLGKCVENKLIQLRKNFSLEDTSMDFIKWNELLINLLKGFSFPILVAFFLFMLSFYLLF